MEPKENYAHKYLATRPAVEAIRFSGKNFKRIMKFMGMPEGLVYEQGVIRKYCSFSPFGESGLIDTIDWTAREGDYIVKKEDGTFTSIDGEKFNKYYKFKEQ